jgi:hypothetical protein
MNASGFNGESFDLVSFLQGRSGRLYVPDWKHITKAEAEQWQEQISLKKRATLDCDSGPSRDPWDGISSVPGIRNTREQPRTDSGELRSQRRLQLAFL